MLIVLLVVPPTKNYVAVCRLFLAFHKVKLWSFMGALNANFLETIRVIAHKKAWKDFWINPNLNIEVAAAFIMMKRVTNCSRSHNFIKHVSEVRSESKIVV